jgi:hypothetical protein
MTERISYPIRVARYQSNQHKTIRLRGWFCVWCIATSSLLQTGLYLGKRVVPREGAIMWWFDPMFWEALFEALITPAKPEEKA